MVKLNQNLSARHAWPVDDQANRADRRQRLRIRRDADAVDGETILPAGYRLHEQFNLRARVPERNRCRRPSAAASETIRLEPDPRIDGSTSLMRPGIHKGSIVRCDHRRRHRVKQDRRSVALRPRRLRVTEAAQLGRRHTSSRARSQKTTPRKPVSHPGAPRLHAHPLPPSGYGTSTISVGFNCREPARIATPAPRCSAGAESAWTVRVRALVPHSPQTNSVQSIACAVRSTLWCSVATPQFKHSRRSIPIPPGVVGRYKSDLRRCNPRTSDPTRPPSTCDHRTVKHS